jgi:hypothetical protein
MCRKAKVALIIDDAHAIARPERFQVLRIEGSDSLSLERLENSSLPLNWAEDIGSTQALRRPMALQKTLFVIAGAKRACAGDMEHSGKPATHRG